MWAMHGAAIIALGLALTGPALRPGPDQWRLIAVAALVLALVYVGHALLERSPLGAVVGLAMIGLTWVAAVSAVDPEPWTGFLMTPLIGLYIAVAYESPRVRWAGKLFTSWAELYVHAAVVLALLWTIHSADTTGDLLGDQAWQLYAATLAAIAGFYAIFAIRSKERFVGLTSMVALGLAWLCLLNGVNTWPWRGLAFTPVMAFYVFVASRRPAIRGLFASEPEALITGGSIIVSDQGINQGETGEGTDFIVSLR